MAATTGMRTIIGRVFSGLLALLAVAVLAAFPIELAIGNLLLIAGIVLLPCWASALAILYLIGEGFEDLDR